MDTHQGVQTDLRENKIIGSIYRVQNEEELSFGRCHKKFFLLVRKCVSEFPSQQPNYEGDDDEN